MVSSFDELTDPGVKQGTRAVFRNCVLAQQQQQPETAVEQDRGKAHTFPQKHDDLPFAPIVILPVFHRQSVEVQSCSCLCPQLEQGLVSVFYTQDSFQYCKMKSCSLLCPNATQDLQPLHKYATCLSCWASLPAIDAEAMRANTAETWGSLFHQSFFLLKWHEIAWITRKIGTHSTTLSCIRRL